MFTPSLFAEDFSKDVESERVRLNAFSEHYKEEKNWNSQRQKSVKEIADQRHQKEVADEKARQEYLLQKKKQAPAFDENSAAYKEEEKLKKQKEMQDEKARQEYVGKKSILQKFKRPISEEKELFVMEDRERVASNRRKWITGGRASLGSGSSGGSDFGGGSSSGSNNDLPPPPPAYNPGTPDIFENDYPPPPPPPGFPQEFDDPILPPPVFDGGEY